MHANEIMGGALPVTGVRLTAASRFPKPSREQQKGESVTNGVCEAPSEQARLYCTLRLFLQMRIPRVFVAVVLPEHVGDEGGTEAEFSGHVLAGTAGFELDDDVVG